jgi:hypothetical protein
VAAVEADLADGGVENWAIGHVEAADGAGVELRA